MSAEQTYHLPDNIFFTVFGHGEKQNLAPKTKQKYVISTFKYQKHVTI